MPVIMVASHQAFPKSQCSIDLTKVFRRVRAGTTSLPGRFFQALPLPKPSSDWHRSDPQPETAGILGPQFRPEAMPS